MRFRVPKILKTSCCGGSLAIHNDVKQTTKYWNNRNNYGKHWVHRYRCSKCNRITDCWPMTVAKTWDNDKLDNLYV